MFKKKRLWMLLFMVVFVLGAAKLFQHYKELPKSRILVKKMSEKVLKDGSVAITIPIAALPKRDDAQVWEIVQGKVIRVPNNPSNAKSNQMLAIETGKEVVVVTNLLYVRTLECFYLGKNVILRGKWRKDAVIFGRSYRSFWIEDISLNGKVNS